MMPDSPSGLLLAKAIEQPSTSGPGTQWGLPGTARGGDIGCLEFPRLNRGGLVKAVTEFQAPPKE